MKLSSIILLLLTPLFSFASPYPICGTVTKMDPDARTLTLNPESPNSPPISGTISPGDALIPYNNTHIHAYYTPDPTPHFEDIWPYEHEWTEAEKHTNLKLEADTVDRRGHINRRIGETTPPFALYTQNAKPFTNKDLEGKVTVLNFFFTRCRNPHMCPAATKRMKQLQDRVFEEKIPNVQFVSISIDPIHDTPGDLKLFQDAYDIHDNNYFFLSGDAQAVKNLMRQFNIFSVADKDTLNHTMNTLIFDDQARIVYGKQGHSWDLEDFIQQLVRLSGTDKYPRI